MSGDLVPVHTLYSERMHSVFFLYSLNVIRRKTRSLLGRFYDED